MTLNLPIELQQQLETLAEKANKTPEQLGIELLQDIVESAMDDVTLLGPIND